MGDAPLLSVHDLAVHLGKRTLLRGVNFELGAGQALTLLGESGAGKSLLAQAIMGKLPPALRASGEVTLAGKSSPAANTSARRPFWGRKLALLPQEPSLALDPLRRILPQLTEVHALVRNQEALAAGRTAHQALEAVGLDGAQHLYPWQVSGGMAQRAAATVALAGGAQVLLVDEPTKGLDAHWCERIVALFRQVLQKGGCVLTITHDLRVAQAMGGQVAVLRDGAVVEQGDAAQVLANPSHAFTRRLIAAAPARWARREARPCGGSLLRGHGLSKAFGGHTLFENLDLDIGQGERLVLQGPSGSGKSTLGNVLLGLVAPDAGRVERAAGLAPQACQKLYQDPTASFPAHITLGQALRDVARKHGTPWPAVQALLGRMGVTEDLLARQPAAVSGGELQRIALARVLAVRPAVLFADEPTSRLDLITQQETLALLMETADDSGAALVLVTHDGDLAEAVSTKRLRFGLGTGAKPA